MKSNRRNKYFIKATWFIILIFLNSCDTYKKNGSFKKLISERYEIVFSSEFSKSKYQFTNDSLKFVSSQGKEILLDTLQLSIKEKDDISYLFFTLGPYPLIKMRKKNI